MIVLDMVKAFRTILNVQPRELPFALLMSLQFFFIIAAFWILKPLKKTLFIEHYDNMSFVFAGIQFDAARTELLAKNLNMLVALVAMWVFILVARRFKRQWLILALGALCTLCLVAVGTWLSTGHVAAKWAFYAFGDLFNMFMVAGFFAFLNDAVSPAQAKRLYGPVVFGGVLGGVIGSTLFRTLVGSHPVEIWLVISGFMVLSIAVCALLAARYAGQHRDIFPWQQDDKAPEMKASAPLEGFQLVRKSRYLLSIAGVVGLYEVVSTVIDYQFTSAVERYLDGPAIGTHFATVYMIVNIVSLAVQVLLTSALMNRAGVSRTLLALPGALLLGSLAFAAAPILMVASFLCIADNGLNYSINQSSRESLYVIVSRQRKYAAKAFIDIFVQRSAKAVGVNLTLLLTTVLSGRWLALLSIGLIMVWLKAAAYAGARFESDQEDSWEERKSASQTNRKRGLLQTILSGISARH